MVGRLAKAEMRKPKADPTTEDAAELTEFGPSTEVASVKHRIDKILTGTEGGSRYPYSC
jgi:hypothetical protein